MNDVTMEFSEARGTWSVFVNGEWYFEGDFERCCDIVNSFNCPEEPEPEYDEVDYPELDELEYE